MTDQDDIERFPRGVTWEEALRLNGKPGYTPKDALNERERIPAARRAKEPPVDRKWVVLATEQRTCERHGDYQSRQEQITPSTPLNKAFWTQCPQCDSEIASEQKSTSLNSQEMKRAIEQLRLIGAGIPERHMASEFWNFQHRIPRMDKVWQELSSYAMSMPDAIEAGRCAIFYGNAGTGKSHLACAILRVLLLKHGGTGIYVTQARLISRLKATMEKGATETELDVFDAIAKPDLVVVDEIGRGSQSSWERSVLFRVIDERYQRKCKPTVLVSNLTLDELVAEMSPAGLDRMRESGGLRVHFNWDSQRVSKP